MMIVRLPLLFLCLVAWSMITGMVSASESVQPGRFYPDGHGGYVYFPLADISFADRVVNYRTGSPPPSADYRFPPDEALRPPDYDTSTDRGYVTLGCGGSLTLQFADNALVDVPGPDLYVFEIGDALEPTRLEISGDGRRWVDVGKISGGRAAVDISGTSGNARSFRYVRLTDLQSACNNDAPGADIDAVGAIGSGVRLTLAGKVLFDSGKSELKDEAFVELDTLADYFGDRENLMVEVAGHTDAVGTEAANRTLSEQRAHSVADYLTRHFRLSPEQVRITGYGESQPVADNATEEGRQANRRVEIVLTRIDGNRAGGRLWKTGWGLMALAFGPDGRAAGVYPEDNGRVFGSRQGFVFNGFWVENASSRKCASEKDGSFHWGRLHLEFSKNNQRFDGWWTYCNDDAHAGILYGEKAR